MSLLTQDTFTDTAGVLLENHTGETGATWTKNAAFSTGSAKITAAGRLRGDANNTVYYASAVPPSADYDVEADLFVASNLSLVGLLGRQDPAAFTYYLFDVQNAGGLTLFTVVNGATLNQTNVAFTPTVGQTYHFRLSMRGGRITCYVDGTAMISLTDANIAAAGRAGVFFGAQTTDATGYHFDNFFASVPQTAAVTDANLFFSPYNWHSDGTGAMQGNNIQAGSTAAQTTNPGAYLKFGLTAVANGVATLLLDTSPLNGITAANCPTLAVSLDGQAFTAPLLAYATGTTRLTISNNLPAGSHTVEIYFRSVTLSSSTAMGDRWTAPAGVVKVTGLELDGKGSATAAPTLRGKRVLVFGDSITEGADAVGSANANADQDATQTYAQLVARALDAEVGVVGYSAQGWTAGGYGNVPRFFDPVTPANSAFDHYSAGVSRLIGGAFAPAPDRILVLHGKNDAAATDANVTAAVAGWITAARADAPATQIAVVVPFDGTKRSAVAAGVAQANDSRTTLIDLGAAPAPTLAGGGLNTNDAIHPNVRGHATFAALLLRQIGLAGSTSVTLSQGSFAT